MLLELKKCGRKGVGKGQRRVLVKTNVCGGPHRSTVKTHFFTCPLFREPGKFAKITGRENLNTVAFQCNRKQKRQNPK